MRRPRRGRRDARHGLRRRPRGDPVEEARPSGRRRCSPRRSRRGIARIAERHLRDPVRVDDRARAARPTRAGRGSGRSPTSSSAATSWRRSAGSSTSRTPTSALVFARTRLEVDELTEALSGRGYDAAALHGGMTQEQRDRVMTRFRDGAIEVLVATDVAARGLDIEHVSHVVNYDVPVGPGGLRPPHRPHGARRPRGRGDHTGRAARAAAAAQHRAADEGAASRSPVPTVADLRARRLELTRRVIARGPAGRRPGPIPRRDRAARGGVRHPRHRPGGGEPGRRGHRPRPGRGGAAGHDAPAAGSTGESPSPARSTGTTVIPRWHDSTGSSAAAGRSACGRPTSSARSPTNPGSAARPSAPSRSPITSPWSRSPKRLPTKSSAP